MAYLNDAIREEFANLAKMREGFESVGDDVILGDEENIWRITLLEAEAGMY